MSNPIIAAALLSASLSALAEDPKFYSDLGWHSTAGVTASLNAAKSVIEKNPGAQIEFLIHGNDIRYFAGGQSRSNPLMIDLANTLKSEKVKFRVCDHALVYKGFQLEHFPEEFGVVDYVPDRIANLRKRGYVALPIIPED
ncbi:MAG: hypothetical protein AAF384_07385 [Pseudomonadota bacterium]